MSSGYQLRKIQAAERRENLPCDGCSHPSYLHREYQATWAFVDGELIETPHPRYRPTLFVCNQDGCGCEVQR